MGLVVLAIVLLAVIAKALLAFTHFGSGPARSLAQVTFYGMTSGVAVGFGIALVTRVLVRAYIKRNEGG